MYIFCAGMGLVAMGVLYFCMVRICVREAAGSSTDASCSCVARSIHKSSLLPLSPPPPSILQGMLCLKRLHDRKLADFTILRSQAELEEALRQQVESSMAGKAAYDSHVVI